MSKPLRLLSLVACVAMLAAFGCRRGQPETTDEPTEEPSPTPSVESLGEFQLVGSVEHAFVAIDPDVDLSAEPTEGLEEDTTERVKANVTGVIRVSLEAFSDNLRDRCAADPDDQFNLFWTTDTLFDPALLSTRDIEARLDGRTLGVIGTVFLRPEAEDEDEDFGQLPAPSETPSDTPAATPQGTPGVTTGEGEQDCVLRAEQVGTSQGALPTPRPRRSTARPTGSSTVSPTGNS